MCLLHDRQSLRPPSTVLCVAYRRRQASVERIGRQRRSEQARGPGGPDDERDNG
jgi:hypothetical protein